MSTPSTEYLEIIQKTKAYLLETYPAVKIVPAPIITYSVVLPKITRPLPPSLPLPTAKRPEPIPAPIPESPADPDAKKTIHTKKEWVSKHDLKADPAYTKEMVELLKALVPHLPLLESP